MNDYFFIEVDLDTPQISREIIYKGFVDRLESYDLDLYSITVGEAPDGQMRLRLKIPKDAMVSVGIDLLNSLEEVFAHPATTHYSWGQIKGY